MLLDLVRLRSLTRVFQGQSTAFSFLFRLANYDDCARRSFCVFKRFFHDRIGFVCLGKTHLGDVKFFSFCYRVLLVISGGANAPNLR